MWHLHLIILIIGLLALVRGSDYFVEASSKIAKKLGISEFVIGLTLVAVGTSIPELVSSVIAAFREHSGLIIGNVIGSNIANIGLAVGLGAAIAPIKTDGWALRRNGYIMLLASVLFLILAFNGVISSREAIIFLILYFAYIILLFREDSKFRRPDQLESESYILFQGRMAGDLLIFTGSGCAIIFGGHLLVKESVWLAGFLGIPESIIGLSIVAVGTSLPELGVSISAARKGYGSMLIGNIIGSNIANIFLVAGVSALIIPLRVMTTTISCLAPSMIVMTLLLLFFIKNNWEIKRREGIFCLFVYTVFIIFVFRFKLA